MKIHFSIPYNLKSGEKIFISGTIKELHFSDIHKAIELELKNGRWCFELNVYYKIDFEYFYIIKDTSGDFVFEAGPARKFKWSSNDIYYVMDEWKTRNDETPFLSSAFKKVLYYRDDHFAEKENDFIIRLSANNIAFETTVIICGNTPMLGNWKPENGHEMVQNSEGFWEAGFSKNELPDVLEYKFLITYNKDAGKKVIWENGENRQINKQITSEKFVLIINHFSINIPAEPIKIAGTAVPLFSLKSKNSCGIGDLGDLKKMIDYLAQTGQNILQLLPINDTTNTHDWPDSYPYKIISTYALHPLYLDLSGAGKIDDPVFMESFRKKAKQLNEMESLDYKNVEILKWSYIKLLYSQKGKSTLESDDFKMFFNKNEDWLIPYSAFCVLRDQHKTAKFSNWPSHSIYNKSEIKKFSSDKLIRDNINLNYFVQFLLYKQLKDAHAYARKKRIILKGDIPIGINRDSVDAWINPSLFNFDCQAGAPPDHFSKEGQNWGFPTYNWEMMKKDDYYWWKNRFRRMQEFFDAFRIDHILGFFRIWEIPANSVNGIMGHFSPSLPLSIKEISYYGYKFNFERDCEPFINELVLDHYFDEAKELVKSRFLTSGKDGNFKLKLEVNSQQKIEEYFNHINNSEWNLYKKGLSLLCTEVLFLTDPDDKTLFHPRINAQLSQSYSSLKKDQKKIFDSIYFEYFYKRNEIYWYKNAYKKISEITSSTEMLVCGEDLGMIPNCVPSLMSSLKIFSLEIQRMPKNSQEIFGDPSKYPYLSVCSTGTHDTSTLREWWEENFSDSKKYYDKVLHKAGNVPLKCESWLCEEILENNLNAQSMFAIFPLQDWLSISSKMRRKNPFDERINDPSNPKQCWNFRMHINIEDLLNNEELTASLIRIIGKSGRLFNCEQKW